MRNVREIAWAAGLFEGEGCFGVPSASASRSSRPQLLLTSTDLDVLQRFHSAVGVGRIAGPKTHKNHPDRKPYWTWFTGTFEGMQAVTAMFWAFLGGRRRARAVDFLKFLSERPRKFADGAYCNAKLTADQAREIHAARGKEPQSALSARYGVSQAVVSSIQLGKSWKHITQATL